MCAKVAGGVFAKEGCPTIEHPLRVRFGCHRDRRCFARQLAQHRVDHARCEAVPGSLNQLHAFANRRVRGNAVHEQHLKCAQPQPDQHFIIELCVRPHQQWANPRIQHHLPAQRAENQRRNQVAVLPGERRDRIAAQQLIGMRAAALHRH